VTTIPYHKHVKITPMTRVILVLWIFSAALLSLKGTRFILLLIGPLSIFAGIFWKEFEETIKNNTSNDTVIITDWSYGHFFTSESQRPVLFDGRLAYIETLPVRKLWYDSSLDSAIPTTARDYWINLALLK